MQNNPLNRVVSLIMFFVIPKKNELDKLWDSTTDINGEYNNSGRLDKMYRFLGIRQLRIVCSEDSDGPLWRYQW